MLRPFYPCQYDPVLIGLVRSLVVSGTDFYILKHNGIIAKP